MATEGGTRMRKIVVTRFMGDEDRISRSLRPGIECVLIYCTTDEEIVAASLNADAIVTALTMQRPRQKGISLSQALLIIVLKRFLITPWL